MQTALLRPVCAFILAVFCSCRSQVFRRKREQDCRRYQPCCRAHPAELSDINNNESTFAACGKDREDFAWLLAQERTV